MADTFHVVGDGWVPFLFLWKILSVVASHHTQSQHVSSVFYKVKFADHQPLCLRVEIVYWDILYCTTAT